MKLSQVSVVPYNVCDPSHQVRYYVAFWGFDLCIFSDSRFNKLRFVTKFITVSCPYVTIATVLVRLRGKLLSSIVQHHYICPV